MSNLSCLYLAYQDKQKMETKNKKKYKLLFIIFIALAISIFNALNVLASSPFSENEIEKAKELCKSYVLALSEDKTKLVCLDVKEKIDLEDIVGHSVKVENCHVEIEKDVFEKNRTWQWKVTLKPLNDVFSVIFDEKIEGKKSKVEIKAMTGEEPASTIELLSNTEDEVRTLVKAEFKGTLIELLVNQDTIILSKLSSYKEEATLATLYFKDKGVLKLPSFQKLDFNQDEFVKVFYENNIENSTLSISFYQKKESKKCKVGDTYISKSGYSYKIIGCEGTEIDESQYPTVEGNYLYVVGKGLSAYPNLQIAVDKSVTEAREKTMEIVSEVLNKEINIADLTSQPVKTYLYRLESRQKKLYYAAHSVVEVNMAYSFFVTEDGEEIKGSEILEELKEKCDSIRQAQKNKKEKTIKIEDFLGCEKKEEVEQTETTKAGIRKVKRETSPMLIDEFPVFSAKLTLKKAEDKNLLESAMLVPAKQHEYCIPIYGKEKEIVTEAYITTGKEFSVEKTKEDKRSIKLNDGYINFSKMKEYPCNSQYFSVGGPSTVLIGKEGIEAIKLTEIGSYIQFRVSENHKTKKIANLEMRELNVYFDRSKCTSSNACALLLDKCSLFLINNRKFYYLSPSNLVIFNITKLKEFVSFDFSSEKETIVYGIGEVKIKEKKFHEAKELEDVEIEEGKTWFKIIINEESILPEYEYVEKELTLENLGISLTKLRKASTKDELDEAYKELAKEIENKCKEFGIDEIGKTYLLLELAYEFCKKKAELGLLTEEEQEECKSIKESEKEVEKFGKPSIALPEKRKKRRNLLVFKGNCKEEYKGKLYTVQEGETLRKIIRKVYGLNEKEHWKKINKLVIEVKEINNIPDPDLIYPGDVLCLPEAEAGMVEVTTKLPPVKKPVTLEKVKKEVEKKVSSLPHLAAFNNLVHLIEWIINMDTTDKFCYVEIENNPLFPINPEDLTGYRVYISSISPFKPIHQLQRKDVVGSDLASETRDPCLFIALTKIEERGVDKFVKGKIVCLSEDAKIREIEEDDADFINVFSGLLNSQHQEKEAEIFLTVYPAELTINKKAFLTGGHRALLLKTILRSTNVFRIAPYLIEAPPGPPFTIPAPWKAYIIPETGGKVFFFRSEYLPYEAGIEAGWPLSNAKVIMLGIIDERTAKGLPRCTPR